MLHSTTYFANTVTSYLDITTTYLIIPYDDYPPYNIGSTFLTTPWRRDTWTPTISRMELYRLHHAIKHPESTSMSNVIRKSLGDSPLTPDLKKELESIRWSECAQTSELPRRPKLAFPHEATPNIVLSLDVMFHKIRTVSTDVLFMINHADMTLRLNTLQDRTAPTALNSFYKHWISVYDAPTYVLVDRGSNLAAEFMKEKLHEVDAQLCPIPKEAPWGIGLNERSHHYLHKSIHRLLLQKDYDTGHNHEVLLSDVEVGWNYAQHSNNVLLHYHRFGIMPRLLVTLDESPRITERVALMHLARQETEKLRTLDFILRALDNTHRSIMSMKSFSVNEKVWSHRKSHEWHAGIISAIDHPTVTVQFEGKTVSHSPQSRSTTLWRTHYTFRPQG